MDSIFEDDRILDELIVGYCVIFNRNDDLLISVSWDDYSDTNDQVFSVENYRAVEGRDDLDNQMGVPNV
jgi:hypothetical protein